MAKSKIIIFSAIVVPLITIAVTVAQHKTDEETTREKNRELMNKK